MIRLFFNENTAGCSPAVLAAIRSITPQEIATYPDYAAITAKCERFFGVDHGWVQLTNGLDAGLQTLAQDTWTGSGPARRKPGLTPSEVPSILIVEPAFEMYGIFAETAGADVVRVQCDADFHFPTDAVLAALTPATRLVYLTDPNNPTGTALPADAVERIAAAAPQAIVLVDEAYADFSGRTHIGPLLDRRRNVIVGRTFAKAHGLAGLRVGALVAHKDILDRLRPSLEPFAVNICAVKALGAALEDRAYVDAYVAQAAASRQLVYDFCWRHGLRSWPSDGNFVLFRVGDDAAAVVAALAKHGILVKDKSDTPGCAGCIRMTAGTIEDTNTALEALEAILASRAR